MVNKKNTQEHYNNKCKGQCKQQCLYLSRFRESEDFKRFHQTVYTTIGKQTTG